MTLVVAWRDLETMVTGIESAVVSGSVRASLERLAWTKVLSPPGGA